MKFSTYLTEISNSNYKKEITKDECIKLLTQLYKNKDNLPKYIYRGMDSKSKILLIEGKKGNRVSRNTSNHYTKIIDYNIHKLNKDYPLRSKSIIASTYKYTADHFGELYYIIPFPDTIIGQCEYDDLWSTEITMGTTTRSINLWNNIWQEAEIFDYIDNADELADAIIKIVETYETTKKKHHFKVYHIFKNVKDIKDEVNTAYSIDNLNMTFGTLSTLKLGGDNEVWIGDKCIAIHEDEIENIIPFIGK